MVVAVLFWFDVFVFRCSVGSGGGVDGCGQTSYSQEEKRGGEKVHHGR